MNGRTLVEHVNPDAKWAKWLQLLWPMLIVPWMAWLSMEIINSKIQLSAINSSRFTAADARIVGENNAEEHLGIWKQLALKANSTDVPPAEVRESLREIKQELRELREMVMDFHLNGGKRD